MSTGPRGSLDSQDRILFNDIISDPALDLPYDGVAPTEGDFGIILYAFERDLDVFLITRMKSQGQGQGRLPASGGGESGEEGGRRKDGGGGERGPGPLQCLDRRSDQISIASFRRLDTVRYFSWWFGESAVRSYSQ